MSSITTPQAARKIIATSTRQVADALEQATKAKGLCEPEDANANYLWSNLIRLCEDFARGKPNARLNSGNKKETDKSSQCDGGSQAGS